MKPSRQNSDTGDRQQPAAILEQVREARQKSEAHFRRLVENSLDVILLLDRDGGIGYASPSTANVLDFDPEELVGRRLFELIHSDDLGHAQNLLLNCLERPGRPIDAEFRLQRRDETYREIECLAVNRLDEFGIHGIVASARDVTERRHTQEDRHLFFSLSVDMLCIAGFDGYFKELNLAWQKTLGFSGDELKGRPFLEFVHPDDRHTADQEWKKLEDGREIPSLEIRFLCKDGSYKWLLWSFGVSRERKMFFAVARDVTDRRLAEDRLRFDAFHDSLTGLPNRALFLENVSHHMARSRRRPNRLFAVLFLDLDSFKQINDSMGHLAGDQLLIEISRRLLVCVRPGDMVARLAGDEFAVLLEDLAEPVDPLHVAHRIEAGLAYPFRVGEHEVLCTASIGAIVFDGICERPEDLLRLADQAMYRAKAAGKNRSILA